MQTCHPFPNFIASFSFPLIFSFSVPLHSPFLPFLSSSWPFLSSSWPYTFPQRPSFPMCSFFPFFSSTFRLRCSFLVFAIILSNFFPLSSFFLILCDFSSNFSPLPFLCAHYFIFSAIFLSSSLPFISSVLTLSSSLLFLSSAFFVPPFFYSVPRHVSVLECPYMHITQ